MIHLTKQPKPEVLVNHEVQWRDEYLAARANPPVSDAIRYRYRHVDVKTALRNEAQDKCVYCERKVTPGETDHIFPVVHRPELIVDWDNLCLACKDCNTYKGEYYSAVEPLINPFVDEPREHLLVFGPLVMAQIGNQLGFRTVERIRLYRMELVERRKERIERLQALVEQWNSFPAGRTKDLAREKIIEEASADREFSAVVRAYLYQALGWVVA